MFRMSITPIRSWTSPRSCGHGSRRAALGSAFWTPCGIGSRAGKDRKHQSEDHRRWLRHIAFDGPTCAVHFTGHSDHPSLERELQSLHDDAAAEGYEASRAFKRQHYVVFLAIRYLGKDGQAEQLAAEIERRVSRAWISWGRAFTSCRSWRIRTYRNGVLCKTRWRAGRTRKIAHRSAPSILGFEISVLPWLDKEGFVCAKAWLVRCRIIVAKSSTTCPYCGFECNVLPQLRDRNWAYRRSGLFGRKDHQCGGCRSRYNNSTRCSMGGGLRMRRA
jgi:hypothetical protein